MKLYELLILATYIPLSFFGCMWTYRIIAGVVVVKIVKQAKEQAVQALTKKGDESCTNANTDAGTQTSTAGQ